jgi:hypothetical protein
MHWSRRPGRFPMDSHHRRPSDAGRYDSCSAAAQGMDGCWAAQKASVVRRRTQLAEWRPEGRLAERAGGCDGDKETATNEILDGDGHGGAPG